MFRLLLGAEIVSQFCPAPGDRLLTRACRRVCPGEYTRIFDTFQLKAMTPYVRF